MRKLITMKELPSIMVQRAGETRTDYLLRLREIASTMRIARTVRETGVEYSFFEYHYNVMKALISKMFDCDLGRKEYSKLTAEERKAEYDKLEDKHEEHGQKARIFARMCGIRLC